jgi:hypothetical protein
MIEFFDLFVQSSRLQEAWQDPTWADRRFAPLLDKSPLRPWKPDDPVSKSGERWLIGVATWSGFDMRLLDVVAGALSRNSEPMPVVEVFNTAECRSAADFKRYIPKLMPVVGAWQDGRLDWTGQGYEAREHAARRFGSGSAEIVAYVQDWTKAQAATP